MFLFLLLWNLSSVYIECSFICKTAYFSDKKKIAKPPQHSTRLHPCSGRLRSAKVPKFNWKRKWYFVANQKYLVYHLICFDLYLLPFADYLFKYSSKSKKKKTKKHCCRCCCSLLWVVCVIIINWSFSCIRFIVVLQIYSRFSVFFWRTRVLKHKTKNKYNNNNKHLKIKFVSLLILVCFFHTKLPKLKHTFRSIKTLTVSGLPCMSV